jgi:hypothetical protein
MGLSRQEGRQPGSGFWSKPVLQLREVRSYPPVLLGDSLKDISLAQLVFLELVGAGADGVVPRPLYHAFFIDVGLAENSEIDDSRYEQSESN